eukprot:GHVS01035872.1.p1 GENE.GHVS01035872.1~~GHVS01035872.1.p1  ORF type:complete len:126 (-),score=5.36 GHVS01035872.1:174-551(-)
MYCVHRTDWFYGVVVCIGCGRAFVELFELLRGLALRGRNASPRSAKMHRKSTAGLSCQWARDAGLCVCLKVFLGVFLSTLPLLPKAMGIANKTPLPVLGRHDPRAFFFLRPPLGSRENAPFRRNE